MHSTHLSSRGKLSKTGASRLKTIIRILIVGAIARIVFMLAIIIDAKIIKTEASFLASKIVDT